MTLPMWLAIGNEVALFAIAVFCLVRWRQAAAQAAYWRAATDTLSRLVDEGYFDPEARRRREIEQLERERLRTQRR
jgi:hypothetical protein